MSSVPLMEAAELLYQRAGTRLSDEELGRLARLNDDAVMEARRMFELCTGLGCLVSEDGRHKAGAGSFQCADSVAELLFSLAHSFDAIGAMAYLGDVAAHDRLTKASDTTDSRAPRSQ